MSGVTRIDLFIGVFVSHEFGRYPTRRVTGLYLLTSSKLGRDQITLPTLFRCGNAHMSSAILCSLAVSAKCIALANSGFSGGAVRSTTGCFGDGGGEEDRTLSVPLVRILWKTRTLHAHDAEALAGWGLHHHPALQAVHDVRA
jgi:hypothetical protein